MNEVILKQQLIIYHSTHITAEVGDVTHIVTAAPIKFFKQLKENLGMSFKDIAKMFKNATLVKFFGKIRFSFKKLWGLLKNGLKHTKILKAAIKKYVEENKIVKFTTEVVQDFDKWLDNYPKLKKVLGVAVAAILIYIWFNMAFTGNAFDDFDLTDALDALNGKYNLADIFTGASGIKLFSLFALGLSGITFPWAGPTSVKFIIAIFKTITRKLFHNKIKVKGELRMSKLKDLKIGETVTATQIKL